MTHLPLRSLMVFEGGAAMVASFARISREMRIESGELRKRQEGGDSDSVEALINLGLWGK